MNINSGLLEVSTFQPKLNLLFFLFEKKKNKEQKIITF